MIAIRAVGLLADRPELFRRFLDLAGIDLPQLKARLGDPALLGAVLDFVLFDDQLTIELAAAMEIEPGVPALARHQLPGAEAP